MFEIHVGSTPCELTQKDYRSLAANSDRYVCWPRRVQRTLTGAHVLRYSGSDIAIVVRDALMQPVRKVLSATHFKRVPSKTDQHPTVDAVLAGRSGCGGTGLEGHRGDELQEPPLRFADFVKSLESVRPTVRDEDIKRHDDWTRESGASALHHVSRPLLRAWTRCLLLLYRRSFSFSFSRSLYCSCIQATTEHDDVIVFPFSWFLCIPAPSDGI